MVVLPFDIFVTPLSRMVAVGTLWLVSIVFTVLTELFVPILVELRDGLTGFLSDNPFCQLFKTFLISGFADKFPLVLLALTLIVVALLLCPLPKLLPLSGGSWLRPLINVVEIVTGPLMVFLGGFGGGGGRLSPCGSFSCCLLLSSALLVDEVVVGCFKVLVVADRGEGIDEPYW